MLIHKKKRAVVLKLRNPAKVTTVIPTAKTFQHKGAELVAVPHRPDETRVLRNLGFDVPDPMPIHYEWPRVGGRHDPFEAQRETASFLAMHSRAFCLNGMGCVDASTEYLSPTGWRRMDDYTGGQVAQYHPETGAIEFVDPVKYVKLPCETMLHLKTKYGVDQMLSPEHRVLLLTKDNLGKREVLSAAELAHRHDMWVSGASSQKSRSHIGWSRACIPSTFAAPGGSGLALTDAEIRLQVAVIADGHFPKTSSTTRCTVRLKRPRKVERLHRLLQEAGVEYTAAEQNTRTAQGFTIFKFYAPTRDKVFGPNWWSATHAQLQVIANEVMHWDGSISKDKPTERFSTMSKLSADFVQYAYTGTGRNARVHSALRNGKLEYSVQVRRGGDALQLASVSSTGERRPIAHWVPSTDGFKYCFMVPSTFLLFRRNGCVFASGNTGKTNSTLWAYDYLRRVKQATKILVVCPLSTMERTWADSVFQTFPHLDCAVLYGSRERRLKLLKQDVHVYVINIDGLSIIADALAKRPDIDVIAVDELALARNSSTTRWKTLNTICNKQSTRRVWGLTGSPTPNAPTDAWAQCKLIIPEGASVPRFYGHFRDRVMRQISQFKWIPRPEATEVVYSMMQPAIRFSLDDCTDLPEQTFITREVELSKEQDIAYREMLSKLSAEVAGGQILAVNEAVKVNKLIQIACISAGTPVLTHRGWIAIESVTSNDLVWDGESWVGQQGAVCNGVRDVIDCDGVELTPDHKVLSTNGWVTAKEMSNGRNSAGGRLGWEPVRLPDGYQEGRPNEQRAGSLGVHLRLRDNCGAHQPIPTDAAQESTTALRMPAREQDTRNVAQPAVQHMGPHEATLFGPKKSRLQAVWSAWNNCVQCVGGFVRRVLAGHGGGVPRQPFSGPDRQRRPILAGELPLGYPNRTSTEPKAEGQSGTAIIGAADWHTTLNAVQPSPQRKTTAVYDLVNAGPRSRFVVQSKTGALKIVHNCGVAYDTSGESVVIPSKPRMDVLKEVIEQSEGKVIVFVPLTGALESVAEELRKHWSVEMVHGGTSKAERDRIFGDFQRMADPRVLVANAATMSHGLTLTAATTTVWYAPVNSNEIYLQACARVRRPGQTRTTVIVHICGTDIERKAYKRLANKESMQGLLLDMMKERPEIP